MFQTVQQFPWEIPKRQSEFLNQLKKMQNLKISVKEDIEEVHEVDQSLWPMLGEHIEDVMKDRYVSIQTVLTHRNRMGRSMDDIPATESQSVLVTVENRLTSLVSALVMNQEKRLADTPTPEVIKEAGRCLDLEDILQNEETTEVKNEREKSLKNLMRKANYEYSDIKEIIKQ